MAKYIVDYVKYYKDNPNMAPVRSKMDWINAKDMNGARLEVIKKGDYKRYLWAEIKPRRGPSGELIEVKLVSTSVWPKAKPLSNGNYLIWIHGTGRARNYSYVDPKSGRLVDGGWNYLPDDKRSPVRRVR